MTAPARLLALRLQGFKSFAERTVVEFGPGISAVVGPNGSGKSNLADALRWTLGEQGRALRSRKGEDVIFAGSERRAALGMADVTLVLDNADGLLPVEYSVLELGRRLYRSGENDYLLNKQRVRLRDLVDLLDSAHLADNAFLFIGQGMVDQALALRPEERRPLFEEVAGVRRHERRRRKAEEQLAEAEANLARVDDIVAELRPQARRLAAQAEQQVTRASAGDELAAALVVAAHARWHDACGRHREAADRLARGRAESERAMAELTEAEAETGAISAALGARADVEDDRRAAHERARAALTQLQLREARIGSDLAAVSRDRARLDDEARTAETDLALRRREAATPVPDRDRELETSLTETERALAEALEELGALRAARQTRGDELVTVRRAEAARVAELETARRRKAEAERRVADERTRAARSAGERGEIEARLTPARAATETATVAETTAIVAREIARAAADEAEGARRAAAERATAAGTTLAAVSGRVESARARLAEDETRGIARAARRAGGRRVDEDLQVEPALRAAVEAALGEVARGYRVDPGAITGLAGERGVVVPEGGPHHLSGGSAGRPPGAVTTDEGEFRAALEQHGGGILSDAVRRDAVGVAARILARAAWVADLPTAVALQPIIPPGWVVVTRDGGAVASRDAVALGRSEGPIERRAQLERLEAELGRLTVEAAEAERAAVRAADLADRARAALEVARLAETRAAAGRRAAEEAERVAGRAAESSARESAWDAAQAERLQAEVDRTRGALAALEAAETARATETATGPASDASGLEAWEARVTELRGRRERLATELAAGERIRREAEALVAQAGAAATYDEQRIARAVADARGLAEREVAVLAERDALITEVAAATVHETRAREVLDELRSADSADRERLLAAETAASSARDRLRAADERVRGAEVADLEARLGLDAIREQVLVELAGIGAVGLRALQAAARPDGTVRRPGVARPDGDSGRDAGRRACCGRRRRDGRVRGGPAVRPPRLGVRSARRGPADARSAGLAAPTVPRARRGQPLRGGRIRRAQGPARGARDPGSGPARRDHPDADPHRGALDADRRSVPVDVPGPRDRLRHPVPAALRWRLRPARADRSGRPLGTGVEIVARPPGKKAQALAMLSGGERALTAVALLFAMLEVRPVPFCVLDEVDAALDEANVGRFAEALRSLADATQFIVITHNRGTIEAADALYGVTVGDDSVSRVISLRLDEATAIAERPAGRRADDPSPVTG